MISYQVECLSLGKRPAARSTLTKIECYPSLPEIPLEGDWGAEL